MTSNQTIKRKKLNRHNLTPYFYIVPVFLMLILFVLKPFAFAVIKSFFRYDGALVNEYIGWDNYKRLFSDTVFFKSLGNMLFFIIADTIKFLLPIIAAELCFNLKSVRKQNFYRTSLIIPMVIPSVITYLVWKFLYYPGIGVIASILTKCGVSPSSIPMFLGDTHWVKYSMAAIGFPWVAGINFLLTFAALQSLDTSMFEAAVIDGCPRWKRIIHIDIPCIASQLKTLYVLLFMGIVQNYESVLILTQGGPQNSSIVPGLYMYNVSFSPNGSSESLYGYSCAMAVVLFLICFFVSAFIIKEKKEEAR